jgi:hypothetical protein
MDFNKNMVETMKNNNAKSVFINDAGQWLFHETEGYKEYTRADVGLGDVEIVAKPKKVKPAK